MTWSTKAKDLGLAKIVPHASSSPNVVGRAPSITTMTFSPMELYGAAARCSHLHMVNPALVTPESLMMSALLEQHVDDVSSDFAILSSADNFKDFIKSYFAGTVAAGVAYLAMINDGYVWSDHFENLGGGSGAKKTPDFVFAGPGTGVALLESKGSRSATSGAFDTTVSDGYIDQVEPHLGHVVGSATATHGYCIGAYLQSTTKAELRVHHTAVAAATSGGSRDPTSLSAVQRHNYATVFRLAHSDQLSQQIRSGESPEGVPFVRLVWRGRRWVTSDDSAAVSTSGLGAQFQHWIDRWPWASSFFYNPRFRFAVEETVAATALRRFLQEPGPDGMPEGPALFIERALVPGEPQGGAVFPDGLALVSRTEELPMERVWWDSRTRSLSPS